SSTVKSFVDQAAALTLEPDAKKPAFGSIGPVTTNSLKEHSLCVGFESKHASLDYFVNATTKHLNS
ncbi:uroporphyrinogen-III C-methyltransferase, partial [Puniceicoccaceae bacterium]|nr:uroporphyrinogen-III C-methyltransferase [Puniceicoccaceae bacterium]